MKRWPARVSDARDVCAGLLFLGFGGVALSLAGGYSVGTTMRMGAGYFPLLIGTVLSALGVLILLRGLAFSSEQVGLGGLFSVRAGLSIIGSVVAFALLLPSLGLALATLVMTLLSGLARRKPSFKELTVLGSVLGGFSALVFTWALGLNLPVLPV
ncbi:putative uncharacterized protein [Pseudomonas sp. StFLB209]|uniref:tripartite tricarboxylate transporter TctB family protein n=1 Tax=Pseudomonas sp. StFLB209 TaxID=1028989 RepID=UPI0004F5D28F|nr:tripartite tricarboxylate transporter TctB family protein [Pseudomonas sp. StFLB209]BAP40971.1 putative uncharacterized protein [Pseudomonas sp. StFLB209]